MRRDPSKKSRRLVWGEWSGVIAWGSEDINAAAVVAYRASINTRGSTVRAEACRHVWQDFALLARNHMIEARRAPYLDQ